MLLLTEKCSTRFVSFVVTEKTLQVRKVVEEKT